MEISLIELCLLLKKHYDGIVPEPEIYQDEDQKGLDTIMTIASEIEELFKKTETDKALKTILKFSNFFNQYFQKKQPWSDKSSSCYYSLYFN